MNRNKKATYIQTKKLFTVLTPIIGQINQYQQGKILNILAVSQENKQNFVKFCGMVVR